MLLTLLTLIIQSVNSEQYTTNKLWKDYVRPEWAGNVTINYNEDSIRSIEGIIVPTKSTNRTTSEPYKGCYREYVGHYRFKHEYKGYHRGHVMGLRNGGPDISKNVVPQWGDWQANKGQPWYDFEDYINKEAFELYNWSNTIQPWELNETTKPDDTIYWKINLIYEDNNCEPVRYEGFIFFGEKKYTFDFVNNGTEEIILNPIEPTPTPKKKKSSLFPWICVFIVLSIWICVYFFYRRNIIQHNQIRSVIENSIELEIH